MLKRSVFGIVSGLLVLSSISMSFAETVSTNTYSAQVQTGVVNSGTGINNLVVDKAWNLTEAIEAALQNNIDLLKAKLEYDRAIIDLEQARYNAKSIDADAITNLSTAQTKYVSAKQKELAETVALQAYKIALEQTSFSVEKSYYDIQKAENLVKVREASVKRSQEQLTAVQKKYKSGVAVKTDVNRAEVSLANAKADLVNGQRDLKNVQVAFNKVIGQDVNNNVKIAYVLKYEKLALPTAEELMQQALTNRLEIQKAKNNVVIVQLNYDLVVSYQSPGTSVARNYKIDLDKAKLDVRQQEQSVKAEVISAVSQVQKADEVVSIVTKSLDQAKENYSLAQRRYQIGVGTFADVLSASVDLVDTEAKYTEAVYNYTIAKNQIKTVAVLAE